MRFRHGEGRCKHVQIRLASVSCRAQAPSGCCAVIRKAKASDVKRAVWVGVKADRAGKWWVRMHAPCLRIRRMYLVVDARVLAVQDGL